MILRPRDDGNEIVSSLEARMPDISNKTNSNMSKSNKNGMNCAFPKEKPEKNENPSIKEGLRYVSDPDQSE